ncbi:MAG: tyrosine-type recombinase/integrase [Mageeibacillus sp.]|jgi:integrase|nr:tyrosine-type recombinase/integrase [Mageeibacillus sp.]
MYIHYYRFLALTGMRPSEALGLKHEDVYDNIVVIRRAIVRGGKITSCKNKNARRIVGLNRQAVHELAAQNKLTANLCSEWIFPNQTGSKASQSTIQKHWDRLSERLETKASLYSFRHLYISVMKTHLSEYMLKKLVGHSAEMDTFGVYGHVIDGEMEQAVRDTSEVFDFWLKGAK